MAKCNNQKLLNKITVSKIDKVNTEVSFAVLTDTSDCMRLNAKNYADTINTTTVSYNSYRIPGDMFNCLADGCRNTGTLVVTGLQENSIGASFIASYDATEFYAGVSTFYVYLPGSGIYDVSYTISDSSDNTQTNSDVYTVAVTAIAEGYYPIAIDFSKLPTEQNGTGWTASENGVKVTITVGMDGASIGDPIEYGISSVYFYNSIGELETRDVVKVGCITSRSGDLSFDTADTTCGSAEYDTDSLAVEVTYEGHQVTPNYWKLNPLEGKGDKTEGWNLTTTEKTILGPVTVNGIDFGYVQLADIHLDECGFTTAQLTGSCDVYDSQLAQISAPLPVNIDERQFILLDGTVTGASDAGRILVNTALIGQQILVSYPQNASVESFVANADNMEAKRVRMFETECYSDGTKITRTYNNVLLTSFPGSISNTDETTFSFTASVQPDSNGNYYERQRILA